MPDDPRVPGLVLCAKKNGRQRNAADISHPAPRYPVTGPKNRPDLAGASAHACEIRNASDPTIPPVANQCRSASPDYNVAKWSHDAMSHCEAGLDVSLSAVPRLGAAIGEAAAAARSW